MTQPMPVFDPSTIMPDPPAEPPQAFLCERCGTNGVEYVVSSLTNNDTSQYCGVCIVATFMGAGIEMMAQVLG